MCEAAVIVLNYINYKETVECVDSVLKQRYCTYRIVIVDNGSDNESYTYLKRKYLSKENVSVIRANKNYGFAKGHNIGINYVKKNFPAEYFLLLNSDTILPEADYIRKLIDADEDKVGVIGSKIVMRNGKEQKKLEGYIEFPATLFYFLFTFACYNGINIMAEYFGKLTKRYARVELLHGSAFMLTPRYFQFYNGLCDKTFLYGEEDLLYIYCNRHDLKEKKIDDTFIIHKGGQSARLFYDGGVPEKDSYRLKSLKVLLYESFLDYINIYRRLLKNDKID